MSTKSVAIQFEVYAEEGFDLVEEFYNDENQEAKTEQVQVETTTIAMPKSNSSEGFMQDIQQGLQRSVQALN